MTRLMAYRLRCLGRQIAPLPMLSAGLLIVALLVAMPMRAQAQEVALGAEPTQPGTPLEITADFLRVDQAAGESIFTGNVIAGQGDMRLTADEVRVYAFMTEGGRPSGIERIEAYGNVILVTSAEAAEADRAIFYPDRNYVDMMGDAILVQGANVLAGDHIVVDMRTGLGRADGRVRSIIRTDP